MNIDWSTIETGDILFTDSNKLTINKPYPFKLLALYSVSMWGFAGGQAKATLSVSPNVTTIKYLEGVAQGGDTTAREVTAIGLYECEANKEYTLSRDWSGQGGQAGSHKMTAIIQRIGVL